VTVLPQHRLIARVREVCAADPGLDAALMYGSFAAGSGDAHSDIEFWLFFTPGVQADPLQWCSRIAPVAHLVHDASGTAVAFTAAAAGPREDAGRGASPPTGLIRGEFHFARVDDIASVAAWPARGAPVERMLVLDRSGRLRPVLDGLPGQPAPPATAAEIGTLCGRFAHWLLLAHQVAERGETLRAWDALGHVHRHLVWMSRLATGRTEHWLTPSRRAETDLPAEMVARLRGTTAPADPDTIRAALRRCWLLGRDCWTTLADRHHFSVPAVMVDHLDRTF
jgi:lincosamide nucleotidyltransferase